MKKELIIRPRQSGKTTKLIQLAAKEEYGLIVTNNKMQAKRVFELAQKLHLKIPMPITYDEFINRKYAGMNVSALFIDNAEILLQMMAKAPIKAITMSNSDPDGFQNEKQS
jgi:hypothetical protein